MADITTKLAEALRDLRSAVIAHYGAGRHETAIGQCLDEAAAVLAAHEAAKPAEPVAWMYELATNVTDDGYDGYDGWTLCLTRYRPNVPEGALRGITPLFPAPVAQAEEVKADPSQVICPSCSHQFRAIPCDVQRLMLDAGFEPPFVAAPVAQAEPRKPLTDDEIKKLYALNHWHEIDYFTWGAASVVARAIEAAHGIKE